MAKRFVEAEKRDPFRNFKFRIMMGGIEVAACRKMSGLDATVNVVKFRAGNNNSTVDEALPGRVEYAPVTFEAGLTKDRTFEDWANALIRHGHSEENVRKAEPEFRRDVEIRILDIDGTEVTRYRLFHAWVSKFTAVSDLMADGNDVLIETLEVTHEGFSRVEPGAP